MALAYRKFKGGAGRAELASSNAAGRNHPYGILLGMVRERAVYMQATAIHIFLRRRMFLGYTVCSLGHSKAHCPVTSIMFRHETLERFLPAHFVLVYNGEHEGGRGWLPSRLLRSMLPRLHGHEELVD